MSDTSVLLMHVSVPAAGVSNAELLYVFCLCCVMVNRQSELEQNNVLCCSESQSVWLEVYKESELQMSKFCENIKNVFLLENRSLCCLNTDLFSLSLSVHSYWLTLDEENFIWWELLIPVRSWKLCVFLRISHIKFFQVKLLLNRTKVFLKLLSLLIKVKGSDWNLCPFFGVTLLFSSVLNMNGSPFKCSS